MLVSVLICIEALKLGFGSMKEPAAGFMPFIAGLIMGFLAAADLISGLMGAWKDYADESAWKQTSWPKLASTIAVLFAYALLFRFLGFIADTFLLLMFFVQVMGRKSWLLTVAISGLTTGVFYLVFKTFLECQLPSGFLGF